MRKRRKTNLRPSRRLRNTLLLGLILPLGSAIASQELQVIPEATQPPRESDQASTQLIENFITVIGAKESFDQIHSITARGHLKEGLKHRDFELIETKDGKRRLRIYWKHLGRKHEEVTFSDGKVVWHQTVAPEEEKPTKLGGLQAKHFARQNWILHPFRTDSVFRHHGIENVGSRDTHVVITQDADGQPAWFYFDQDNFLILRWGGFDTVQRTKLKREYQATKFKRHDGILFPEEITMLVGGNEYGQAKVEEVEINAPFTPSIFYHVPIGSPLLRQASGSN